MFSELSTKSSWTAKVNEDPVNRFFIDWYDRIPRLLSERKYSKIAVDISKETRIYYNILVFPHLLRPS